MFLFESGICIGGLGFIILLVILNDHRRNKTMAKSTSIMYKLGGIMAIIGGILAIIGAIIQNV